MHRNEREQTIVARRMKYAAIWGIEVKPGKLRKSRPADPERAKPLRFETDWNERNRRKDYAFDLNAELAQWEIEL